LNYRLFIFIVTLVFGLAFSMPSFLKTESGPKISLGLDLQGGLYMLLGVKIDEAVKSKIKSITSSIKYYCNSNEILYQDLHFSPNNITFTLYSQSEADKLSSELLETIEGLVVQKNGLDFTVLLSDAELVSVKKYAVNQAVDTIRNRLDQFGLAEPSVTKYGDDNIVVQLPGIKTQEEEKKVRALISKPANLQLMAVDHKRESAMLSMTPLQLSDYGDIILMGVDGVSKYLVKEIPILDGTKLTDARVAYDQNNQVLISFTLNSEGARIFGDFTENNIGNKLAVVLDGKVYTNPTIQSRIGGGHGQITGNFTAEEATSVAIALRSGSLLAPVEMLEKRSVGPSLGQDNINASMLALLGGFLLVVIFMGFYYKLAGIFANIALIVNLLLIISVMSIFGATLTLPGMAGIVLTVGMAVDANVIIVERIREILKGGGNMLKAMESGYNNAIRAILDANITTLIVAIVLYAYGTGPIRGFAITISIGIIASMLTSILGTHGVYIYFTNKLKASKNSNLWFGLKVKD
jgi:preprotein translocase subunit SecD